MKFFDALESRVLLHGALSAAHPFVAASTAGGLVHTVIQMPEKRGHAIGISAGRFFVVAGGASSTPGTAATDVEVLDLATNQWSVTTPPDGANIVSGAVAVGNLAVVPINGGQAGPGNTVDIYDASSGQWRSTHMSRRRFYPAAAAAGGKVVFTGGTQSGDTHVADILDVATGIWSTSRFVGIPFQSIAVGVGSLALFSPSADGLDNLDNLTIYDSVSGQWSQVPVPKDGLGTVATAAGTKAVFTSDAGQRLEFFDALTRTWSSVAVPSAMWATVSGEGASATALGDNVVFAGGDISQQVCIYNMSTGKWSSQSLSTENSLMATASVGNQAFFAGGQWNVDASTTANAEVFADTTPTAVLSGWISGQRGGMVSISAKNVGDGALAAGAVIKLFATAKRRPAVMVGTITLSSAAESGDEIRVKMAVAVPAGAVRGGPVDAATMLHEAKWVVETTEKAMDDAKGDGAKFKAYFRTAHAERLKNEHGLTVEPVTFDPPADQDSNSALTYNDPSGRPLAPKLPPPPVDGPDVTIKPAMALQLREAKADGARALKDRRGGGWQLGNQGRVELLLAAHSMNKIETLYGTIFEDILGEKISTKPVEIVNPFPWVKAEAKDRVER